MTTTPSPALLAALEATARFGPIASLFAAREAMASVALDRAGQTYVMDADGGFDAGPRGQMTHSQPWVIERSPGTLARVQVDTVLTPDECRELARQLATAAEHLDARETPAVAREETT